MCLASSGTQCPGLQNRLREKKILSSISKFCKKVIVKICSFFSLMFVCLLPTCVAHRVPNCLIHSTPPEPQSDQSGINATSKSILKNQVNLSLCESCCLDRYVGAFTVPLQESAGWHGTGTVTRFKVQARSIVKLAAKVSYLL